MTSTVPPETPAERTQPLPRIGERDIPAEVFVPEDAPYDADALAARFNLDRDAVRLVDAGVVHHDAEVCESDNCDPHPAVGYVDFVALPGFGGWRHNAWLCLSELLGFYRDYVDEASTISIELVATDVVNGQPVAVAA